jgi:catechol 2,3-dioxygenase-like lactoylglutathione lyase family enzyme
MADAPPTPFLGVHSIDSFGFTVPDLREARRFFTCFGLDVTERDGALDLRTKGGAHRWGVLSQGERKQLHFLSFGIFAEDEARFRAHLEALGVAAQSAPADAPDAGGIWITSPDGVPIQIRIAEKNSPTAREMHDAGDNGSGRTGACLRSEAPEIAPLRLSHVAVFTTDVTRMRDFCVEVLGLGLSDRSADVIAFLHARHGSDHHILALIKSDAPGFHHSSWTVRSFEEVGLGAAQMAAQGYDRGWGVGRHVLGSNYFYYSRDPWGSYAEYSADMDFIPATENWASSDQAPEDSMFLWGPNPPEDFVANYEARQST